jgi:hypothetical protein
MLYSYSILYTDGVGLSLDPAVIDLYACGDCLICARSDGLLVVISMDLELLQVVLVVAVVISMDLELLQVVLVVVVVVV